MGTMSIDFLQLMCKLQNWRCRGCPTEIACPGLRPAALFNVRSHRASDGVNSGYESVWACQVSYRGDSPQRIFSASTPTPPPSSFFHHPGRRPGFMKVSEVCDANMANAGSKGQDVRIGQTRPEPTARYHLARQVRGGGGFSRSL